MFNVYITEHDYVLSHYMLSLVHREGVENIGKKGMKKKIGRKINGFSECRSKQIGGGEVCLLHYSNGEECLITLSRPLSSPPIKALL